MGGLGTTIRLRPCMRKRETYGVRRKLSFDEGSHVLYQLGPGCPSPKLWSLAFDRLSKP